MAKKSKILIAGDSFSTIWPNTSGSWVELLSHDFDVTNLSSAGIGEYKILKQIKSVDTSLFNIVIVNHTSPSRLHTKNHPLHKNGLHKNCDLIYTDLENRLDWFNENLRISKKFFEYHYDDEYQIDIYKLIRKEINDIIKSRYISVCHTEISAKFFIEEERLDCSGIWSRNKGSINHYTEYGNKQVYKLLKEYINV